MRRIPIADVWRVLYAEELDGKAEVTPGQVRVRCPFHNDRRPSCDVHLTKNTFLCRSCGSGGGIVTLICRELNVSADSARAWLKSHC